MKVSILAGLFLCAVLSLAVIGIALSTSLTTDGSGVPANGDSNPFTPGSDTVVGNETPFKPEW